MSDTETGSGATPDPAQTETVCDNTLDSVDGRDTSQQVAEIKNKRKQLRSKFTRTISRLKNFIDKKEGNRYRLNKEHEEIRRLYDSAGEAHSNLYDFVVGENTKTLDDWETDLASDLFNIEFELDNYLKTLHVPHIQRQLPAKNQNENQLGQSNTSNQNQNNGSGQMIGPTGLDLSPHNGPIQNNGSGQIIGPTGLGVSPNGPIQNNGSGQIIGPTGLGVSPNNGSGSFSGMGDAFSIEEAQGPSIGQRYTQCVSFDSWIDDLVEFRQFDVHGHAFENISVAEALYKLEATREIPTITLSKFDGNPLAYVEFIEKFKIHIHDKPHLTNDVRMIQLRMHLIGEAERAISGLGSGGIMYVTALKLIKDQFGQKSVIARAVINRLTKGAKIAANDRQSLREFSFDVISALATFQQMQYFADVNASENLRQVIIRLPDRLIQTWKSVVSDIREKGELPSLQHISNFIRKKVKAEFDPDFGDLDKGRFEKSNEWKNNPRDRRKGVHSTNTQYKKTYKCYICQENNRVMECQIFLDSRVGQRVQLVKDNRLCFSCLVKGHTSKECRSKRACEINGCTRWHHHLLHTDPPCASSASSALDRDCIMPVVRVLFRASNGKCRQGNVLIDSGAGTTIIRKEFSKALGLQGRRENLELSVVGGQRLEQSNSRRVNFWLQGLSGGEEFPVEAHEIGRTILSVPSLDRTWLRSFSHLRDIDFSHRAGPIDLILGVQYSHLHAEEEVRQGLPFEPVGKHTRLGWYVLGSDKSKKTSPVSSVNLITKVNLEKFYQFETLGIQAPDCSCPINILSPDDKRAMSLFESSCKKQGDRYVIGLPWKSNSACLPDNYVLAEKRLVSLEKSLNKNESKAQMYDSAIMEYEKNGWAEKVTDIVKMDNKSVYYLPHHGVYRPDKPSTPLRIVFDPACLYRGMSLNSLLLKGPCLIGNLLGVLLRFREDIVAFTGDIAKMFLQICLPEADTHFHRFLWRNMDTSRDPDIYRLLRVTFGDKPSPDMASFVILKIAEENREKLPNAAVVLQRDRYVDDIIHSCASVQEAQTCMKELDEALSTGCFRIKQWVCSAPVAEQRPVVFDSDLSVVESMSSDKHLKTDVNLDGENVKTLGVSWNPNSDTIKFVVKRIDILRYTKRTILSQISMIFDPLGLASVVTIKARIAMQDIWRQKEFDWDDPLPPNTVSLWKSIFAELERLDGTEFPRCLKSTDAVGAADLHIFCDASEKAYGAVAYLLWQTTTKPDVRLIASKSRVAPLKQSTIPRLELMAALVASRLGKTITDEFKIKPSSVTIWSDSQIVLHWLRSESVTLKAFVGIRVAEIQSTWDPTNWRFVRTSLNPADDLSRGISVQDIDGRWKNGPAFLRESRDKWPEDMTRDILISEVSETRVIKPLGIVVNDVPVIDPSRFSTWQKLLRVTAFCFKFIDKLREKRNNITNTVGEVLQPEEIQRAEHFWVIIAQKGFSDLNHFQDLAPFKEDGIVRVGGRLRNSPLEYDTCHPILLPTSHSVTSLIMRDVHLRMGHVGAERTLCECRRKFWVIRGRNVAKGIVRKCVVCRKLRQPPHSTLMSDLPADRLKPFAPPFSVTGVDLFGPFNLKYGRNKTVKAWGAVFTCATTRAIHLEVVDGLSTPAFLHSLRRFAAHHGWPQTLISDNGSNFVGAQAELRRLVQEGEKDLKDFASLHRVKWIFITPLSPHQGGFYESLVKQTKRALQVAIGQQVLTWNEMSTAFAEAACLINSRPLGYAPNNPNDPQPLTPNHFMFGRASVHVPSGPFEETKNLHKRFEQVQMIVNQFWKRFIREYFPTLTKRAKWRMKGRQLKVDDIVLITDPDTSRGKWNLGRILEVYPGRDGIVRNVKLKTKTGEYRRSVQRCCPIMEMDDCPEDVAET